MNFASDNTAPVAPAILDALAAANAGYARGYGNDEWTARLDRRIAEIFEHEVAVFLVPTGTAANALALAQVSPPWGVVFCHTESHILTDECGAVEGFGGGLKLVGLAGDGGKIAPPILQDALDRYGGHSPHQMIPSALSITQASEAGTIYRSDEIAALADDRPCAIAGHAYGRRAFRQCAGPAQCNAGGTDVAIRYRRLVLWRDQRRGPGRRGGGVFRSRSRSFFGERRKRAGHLLSKHRFIAAQFLAYLEGDCWLTLARHANAMADRLVGKLAGVGLRPVWPVEANLIFLVLPRPLDAKLKAAGANYYVRSSESLDVGSDNVLVRLVTSFATENEDIERFVGLCGTSALRPSAAPIASEAAVRS